MLIDTHAHVNFSAFKDDGPEVIRRSLGNDVWMINVGSQFTTSKRAVRMAEQHEKGVYAAIGLHPIYAQDERFDYGEYKKLALRSLGEGGVVAIGEIGLDYKEEYVSFKEKQKEVLGEQINLAKELKLPIIFHCRMAHSDLISILKNTWSLNSARAEFSDHWDHKKIRGVVHCFTGTWREAKEYLAMGLYLGFNGIIFKMDLDEIIRKTPLDKILIETDCPYLTPLPAEALAKAGPLRNEPIYVKYVVEKIAEIKNLSYEEISKTTTQNAKRLFRI